MTFDMKPEVHIDTNFYKVKGIRNLTDTAFILQLPKCRFKFEAGQHISLSIAGDYQSGNIRSTAQKTGPISSY